MTHPRPYEKTRHLRARSPGRQPLHLVSDDRPARSTATVDHHCPAGHALREITFGEERVDRRLAAVDLTTWRSANAIFLSAPTGARMTTRKVPARCAGPRKSGRR